MYVFKERISMIIKNVFNFLLEFILSFQYQLQDQMNKINQELQHLKMEVSLLCGRVITKMVVNMEFMLRNLILIHQNKGKRLGLIKEHLVSNNSLISQF